MRKIGIITLVVLTISLPLSVLTSAENLDIRADQSIEIENYFINITTNKDVFIVNEEISFKAINETFSNKTLLLWIQDGTQNLKTYIFNKTTSVNLNEYASENVYYINLSVYNVSQSNIKVFVNYILPYTNNFISKKMLYLTNNQSIILNNKLLYASKNVVANSLIKIVLPIEKEEFSLLSYLIYIVIVALIGCTLLLLVNYLKGKRYGRGKRGEAIETPEILEMKKKLLLGSLKELEKEYRSKNISDHTYNRLREEYKSQAVDVMKKLEETKK
jgi:hypothetical protein